MAALFYQSQLSYSGSLERALLFFSFFLEFLGLLEHAAVKFSSNVFQTYPLGGTIVIHHTHIHVVVWEEEMGLYEVSDFSTVIFTFIPISETQVIYSLNFFFWQYIFVGIHSFKKIS